VPDDDDLPAFLVSAPAETTVLAESGQAADVPHGPVERSHEATYHRPYLAHAAMGPSSATAVYADEGGDGGGVRLEVWTHSQGVYRLRRDLLESAKLDDAERALIATWKDQERETSGDVADG